MRRAIAFAVIAMASISIAYSGEAEIKAAQGSIEAQLRAFQAGDDALAYSYAAPNITRIFPTVEAFMGMVAKGYMPVARPKNFAFGKVEENATGQIVQEVFLVGPDGKDYKALYTLERQPDGTFKITGVSLKASDSFST